VAYTIPPSILTVFLRQASRASFRKQQVSVLGLQLYVVSLYRWHVFDTHGHKKADDMMFSDPADGFVGEALLDALVALEADAPSSAIHNSQAVPRQRTTKVNTLSQRLESSSSPSSALEDDLRSIVLPSLGVGSLMQPLMGKQAQRSDLVQDTVNGTATKQPRSPSRTQANNNQRVDKLGRYELQSDRHHITTDGNRISSTDPIRSKAWRKQQNKIRAQAELATRKMNQKEARKTQQPLLKEAKATTQEQKTMRQQQQQPQHEVPNKSAKHLSVGDDSLHGGRGTLFEPAEDKHGWFTQNEIPTLTHRNLPTRPKEHDCEESRYSLRSSAPSNSQIPGLGPASMGREGAVRIKDLAASASRVMASKVPTLPIPIPSGDYLTRSQLQAFQLHIPQPLLVVIDLNGTLLFRTNSKASFKPRANLYNFLDFLLQNHCVMVWSSSKPQNVASMVLQLFKPEQRASLLAVWARDTLRLDTRQFQSKIQVYKQLNWIWGSELCYSHPHAAMGVRWDQSNTILIDDSSKKAAAEPYNLLQIPEFTNVKAENDQVLGKALAYIEWVRWFSNVSAVMRARPFNMDKNLHWNWEKSSPQPEIETNETSSSISNKSRDDS
jgi:NLI interacting factor-like phosphatase